MEGLSKGGLYLTAVLKLKLWTIWSLWRNSMGDFDCVLDVIQRFCSFDFSGVSNRLGLGKMEYFQETYYVFVYIWYSPTYGSA